MYWPCLTKAAISEVPSKASPTPFALIRQSSNFFLECYDHAFTPTDGCWQCIASSPSVQALHLLAKSPPFNRQRCANRAFLLHGILSPVYKLKATCLARTIFINALAVKSGPSKIAAQEALLVIETHFACLHYLWSLSFFHSGLLTTGISSEDQKGCCEVTVPNRSLSWCLKPFSNPHVLPRDNEKRQIMSFLYLQYNDALAPRRGVFQDNKEWLF